MIESEALTRTARLRPTHSVSEAREWALVLNAEGVRAQVVRGEGCYALEVHRSELERCEDLLEGYDAERSPSPAARGREADPPSMMGLVLATASVTFFLVTGPHEPGNLYFEAGSATSAAIRSGEVWRVVTALCLHADLLHCAGNAVLGTLFLNALCGRLGPGVGMLVVLLAGALGNGLNAAAQNSLHRSVGASTAVFGSIGILCGTSVHTRRVEGSHGQRLMVPIAAGLGVIAMLGVGGDRTDLWAHLFGFVVGAVLGVGIGGASRAPRGLQALCGATACVLIAGAWVATG